MSQSISLENLSQEIKTKAQDGACFVIALSGFGGAGKTTLAQKISLLLGGTTIIHLDDFIAPQSVRKNNDIWDSFFDWERLISQVLEPIKEGEDYIEYDVYDWNKDVFSGKKRVTLSKYILIEGVKLIREEFTPYFDCSVWIDVPLTVAIERGKKRDKDEYGVDHDQQWEGVWASNDISYFEKYHPEKLSDYVIENV